MPVLGLHVELNILENEATPSSMLVAIWSHIFIFPCLPWVYIRALVFILFLIIYGVSTFSCIMGLRCLMVSSLKILMLFILQSKLWFRTKVEVGWHTHNHPLIIWNMRLCSSSKLAQRADCGHVLGKADPYVVFKAGGATAKSSTCKGNP